MPFSFLQIGLSVLGFQGIKWLENIGSAFILCSLMYMFYATVQRYGDELSTSLLTMEGSWGDALLERHHAIFGHIQHHDAQR